jgi:hypothetical protein
VGERTCDVDELVSTQSAAFKWEIIYGKGQTEMSRGRGGRELFWV